VVDDERKVGGTSFQTHGPDTAKLRDPHVNIVIVLGTIRSPRAAERRQRRPDKMDLPRADTCRQWYTACMLFADRYAASVRRHKVSL